MQTRHINQDQILDYKENGTAFMRDVLGMDYSKVLTTDISTLSDFTYSGMPEGSLDLSRPRSELVAAWDKWVIGRVQQLYGINLKTTVVSLVWLFNQMNLSQAVTLH